MGSIITYSWPNAIVSRETIGTSKEQNGLNGSRNYQNGFLLGDVGALHFPRLPFPEGKLGMKAMFEFVL